MFEGLQKKWKVGGWRLFLILVTFAVGGSLTGLAARKLIALTGIHRTVVYIPIYLLLITLIWPMMVLLVSVPLGQFPFFRAYLRRIARRFGRPAKTTAMDPKRIVVFASGAGSNARELIRYFKNSPQARVVLVVCNRPGAGVIDIARAEGVPVLMIERERFVRGDAYLPDLQEAKADLLVLAGFLWKVPEALVRAYPSRILNIHPALLPRHGGKGMYGAAVHEAVIGAGDVQSGITIHYVDEHYDNGDVIFQTACPVLPGDTAEKLAARIHALEHLHFPKVVAEVVSKMP